MLILRNTSDLIVTSYYFCHLYQECQDFKNLPCATSLYLRTSVSISKFNVARLDLRNDHVTLLTLDVTGCVP